MRRFGAIAVRAVVLAPLLAAPGGCAEDPQRPTADTRDLAPADAAGEQGDAAPMDGRPEAPATPDGPVHDTADADLDGAAGDAALSCPPGLMWSADHETGDLSQYEAGSTYGGSFDSDCVRPASGVVGSPVHGGQHAMKMTAPVAAATPACRQFRYEESSLGHSSAANTQHNPLYYGAWLYFPHDYTIVDWTNIVQFKSKTFAKDKNDAFWVLELRNRANTQGKQVMYLMLRYKGLYPGPQQGDPTGLQHYHHSLLDLAVPAGKWFHLELFLKQSTNSSGQQSNYDGQLVVWQDGVEIYNMDNIATRYPDSWNEWSINVYAPTGGTLVQGVPTDFTVVVDDVAIDDQPVTACP